MKTTTIRAKLTLALVAFACSLILVIALSSYTHALLIERAALLEAEHVAEVIDSTSNLIGSNNTEALQAYIVQLNEYRPRDIGIVDIHKRVLADKDEEEVGDIYAGDKNNEVGQTILDGKARFYTEDSETGGQPLNQIVVSPRTKNGLGHTAVGAVILEYTPIRDEMMAVERRYLIFMIGGGVGILLFSLVLGLAFSRKITQPLKNLNDGARRIADLDYDARVSVVSDDEIGTLGSTFNQMAERLSTAQAEISEHQKALENRIAERTAELKDANDLLVQSISTLEVEKERAMVTLQSIGDAVVTTDSQMRIEYMNPVAEQMIGWSTEQAQGLHMDDVFNIVNEATRARAVNPIRECLAENRIVGMENHTILIRKTDRHEFHIEDSAAPIRLANGTVVGAIMVFHDVSERQALQLNLKHIAYHDALTGLPNRAFFQSHLSKAITMAKSMNKRVAVMFLDLDRFKAINDSLGHQVGDQLITQAAQRISACVRSGDVIARMGGDEFTATLEGLGDPSDAAIVAQNIIAAVSKPYEINGHELFITASIGISTFPVDGEDIETLLKNADIAMYQAKYAGRDNFKFFTAESNELALENLQFESHLKKALGLDEFFLEYQPKVNLQTGKIDGVEALVRWNSSEFGRVPPDRFISILEESGLIVSVGEWILRTAVVQAKAWLDAGYPLAVSVNFSARQFWQDNLLSMIDSILNEFNLPAHLLEMEITESLIMEDVKNDKLRLIALRGMGIKISLDDFGTGYSSLSYLLRFPIDILKIDKSFIDEMANSESSTEIVKTIILLGHALKMEVIAEGVETEAQAMQLKAIGCDYIQGYWFSRPVPADDISARLLQE
jgi:diguanylate cyclase (GGDEF)-like protein/PAS domain S-box-containing protein